MRGAIDSRRTILVLVCTALLACDDDSAPPYSPPGDALRGGALYDEWWAVTDQEEPEADHPLWASRPDQSRNTATGANTWRCKECHGWDYEGVDGAYGSGSHRTGFKGILGTKKSESEVIALLSDPEGHAYGEHLQNQDLADLAAFVAGSLIDTTTIIAEDGTFKGEAAAGEMRFELCATCHGPKGLNDMPPGSEGGFEDFPGLIANDNPREFLHKIRFGQPGTMMPPQADVLSNDALADLGAYVQTLPQEP